MYLFENPAFSIGFATARLEFFYFIFSFSHQLKMKTLGSIKILNIFIKVSGTYYLLSEFLVAYIFLFLLLRHYYD